MLVLPTQALNGDSMEVPVIIGAHMASQAGLKENDLVTLRWRDANGTFEAVDVRIASVFKTTVPTTDNGIIWISLENLQRMMSQPGKATLLIKNKELATQNLPGWKFMDQTELTKQTVALVKVRGTGYDTPAGAAFLHTRRYDECTACSCAGFCIRASVLYLVCCQRYRHARGRKQFRTSDS